MTEEIEEVEDDSTSEELYEHYRFVADPGQETLRIDKFLMDRIPNTSRNKIQIAAKNGNILVNNAKVKQNYKIKARDEVSIVLPYPVREIELIPEDIPLDIEYEDDDLIVVNKPIWWCTLVMEIILERWSMHWCIILNIYRKEVRTILEDRG